MLLGSLTDELKLNAENFLKCVSRQKNKNLLENKEKSLLKLLHDENENIRKISVYILFKSFTNSIPFQSALTQLACYNHENKLIIYNFPEKMSIELFISMKAELEKYMLNFYDENNDNNYLWFYPPKLAKTAQFNTLNMENDTFENIISNRNLPDPQYYFLGFFCKNISCNNNTERIPKPNNLKFMNSFRNHSKFRRSSLNHDASHCNNNENSFINSKNTSFMNETSKTQNKNAIYVCIKDVEAIFNENSKVIQQIHNTVFQKRHNSIRRQFHQEEESEKTQKNFYFKESYSLQNRTNMNKKPSLISKRFFHTFHKDFTEESISKSQDIYLNQLSVSAITSHRWRNQASRRRILSLTPEFADEKHNFNNVCKKLKKQAKSISFRENDNGKKVSCDFKEKGLMNTNLEQRKYVKLMNNWNENNEKLYGMELEDYKKILQWCKIDQIDRTKPNLNQAIQEVNLINRGRKIIRKKFKPYNTSYIQEEEKNAKIAKTTNFSERKNEKQVNSRPIFERKKIVIKNSGFILKENDDFSVKSPTKPTIEIESGGCFMPMMIKTFKEI